MILMLTCIIIVALARSPEFSLLAPFLVEGNMHNGYVGAYGHGIILLLGLKYFADLADVCALRTRIVADCHASARCHEISATAEYLLRLPFQRPIEAKSPQGIKWWARTLTDLRKCVLPLLPGLIVVISYTAIMWWYFSYFDPHNRAHNVQQLITGWDEAEGVRHWDGFKAQWPVRRGDSEVWINAPLQTWLGLLGWGVLAAVFLRHVWIVFYANSYYRSDFQGGWLTSHKQIGTGEEAK